MHEMRGLLEVTLGLFCFLAGSGAVSITILEPIRSTGDEVGLIFIPENNIDGDKYKETARAIQESSELRVWVALSEDYVFDLLTAPDVRGAVDKAIGALKKAGMTSESYVGVAHGSGARFLQDYVAKSDLKALVLMGSTLTRKTKLRDFPIPVLTLAAELDGVIRITRMVEEYEKLTSDISSILRGLYRTPVIFIEGANHAQFGPGITWSGVNKSKDLAPEITDDKARSLIGKFVNDFLTVTFSLKNDQVDKALDQLMQAFFKSAMKFQPFLDVRNLDTDGEESMWTVLAQEIFAGEYTNRVAISNEILENPWFYGKQPSIAFNDDDMIIGTTALIVPSPKSDSLQSRSDMESPMEINMKLVSKEAIRAALANQNDTTLKSAPNTCASLNRFAVYLALGLSSEAAQDRYLSRGRRIIVEEDAMRGANFLWAPSPLQVWQDAAGLHVRSIALATSKEHYCKVLSPYRAMEWINIDSLLVYPLQG